MPAGRQKICPDGVNACEYGSSEYLAKGNPLKTDVLFTLLCKRRHISKRKWSKFHSLKKDPRRARSLRGSFFDFCPLFVLNAGSQNRELLLALR